MYSQKFVKFILHFSGKRIYTANENRTENH